MSRPLWLRYRRTCVRFVIKFPVAFFLSVQARTISVGGCLTPAYRKGRLLTQEPWKLGGRWACYPKNSKDRRPGKGGWARCRIWNHYTNERVTALLSFMHWRQCIVSIHMRRICVTIALYSGHSIRGPLIYHPGPGRRPYPSNTVVRPTGSSVPPFGSPLRGYRLKCTVRSEEFGAHPWLWEGTVWRT